MRSRYPSLSIIGFNDVDSKCVDIRTREILIDFILRKPELTAYKQLTSTRGDMDRVMTLIIRITDLVY